MPKLEKFSTDNPLVVDIETFDPTISGSNFKTMRMSEYINRTPYCLGCSVYDSSTGKSRYYNLGHKDYKREKDELKALLETDRPKLLANAIYDVYFLEHYENIRVGGFCHDVQIAEPLLDSYAKSYSLATLCAKYGVEGKQNAEIIDIAKSINEKCTDARSLLFLMPYRAVRDYCLGDVAATYRVYEKQIPLLKAQNLVELYEMECQLLRIKVMMKMNGVRIDLKARDESRRIVLCEEEDLQFILSQKYGNFNFNSSAQVAKIFCEQLGITPPLTAKGNFSVDKKFLEKIRKQTDFAEHLLRWKKLNKLRTTFLEKAVDEHITDENRIHCNFDNLKNDVGGTVTGRWTCSKPNLQQIPRNDKKLGGLVRNIFIPEDDCWWGHTDYGQIEYRIFCHYALGWRRGDSIDLLADKVRKTYNEKPDTDYHALAQETIKAVTGHVFDRPTIKRLNFGTLYYMGAASMADNFGMTYEEASNAIAALFHAFPFIESTRELVVRQAKKRGFVKTVLNRRQRYDRNFFTVYDEQTHSRRDTSYALFNYLIQGSAADAMKAALIKCYEAGVYDVLKLHLIVHDETDVSIPKTKEGIEAYAEQKHLMETAVPLRVPLIADLDHGTSWGTTLAGKNEECLANMRKVVGL